MSAGTVDSRELPIDDLIECITRSLNSCDESNFDLLDLLSTALPQLVTADKMLQPFKGSRILLTQGSARTKPDSREWAQYEAFGAEMARRKWKVKTGGGPGSMEAINKGAGLESSIGLRIQLPFEVGYNPNLKPGENATEFKHFFSRKVTMTRFADAVVVLDPGFGTIDEATESLTMIQCGKSPIVPVVFLDTPDGKKLGGKTLLRRYFELYEMMAEEEYATISEGDLSLFHFFEDVNEAADHLDHFYSNYHSMERELLDVKLNLNVELCDNHLDSIRSEFSDFIVGKEFGQRKGTEFAKPCLELTMKSYDYGRLRQLIDAINA